MKTITRSDPMFPNEFRKITDCPEVLYALGNTDVMATKRKAAVIGARKADEAGVDAGGITIAIVATGLDRVFPKEHIDLQESILATGGLVISEQPPGVKANPSKLIARNRLQAALSDFIVVAQCPVKSGTLYTVDFGFHNEINAGNSLLLSQGAQPILYASLCRNFA